MLGVDCLDFAVRTKVELLELKDSEHRLATRHREPTLVGASRYGALRLAARALAADARLLGSAFRGEGAPATADTCLMVHGRGIDFFQAFVERKIRTGAHWIAVAGSVSRTAVGVLAIVARVARARRADRRTRRLRGHPVGAGRLPASGPAIGVDPASCLQCACVRVGE